MEDDTKTNEQHNQAPQDEQPKETLLVEELSTIITPSNTEDQPAELLTTTTTTSSSLIPPTITTEPSLENTTTSTETQTTADPLSTVKLEEITASNEIPTTSSSVSIESVPPSTALEGSSVGSVEASIIPTTSPLASNSSSTTLLPTAPQQSTSNNTNNTNDSMNPVSPKAELDEDEDMSDDQSEDQGDDESPMENGSTPKKLTPSKRQMPLRRTPRKRLIWTSELHNMFVETVNRLGVKAVPTTILHEMNVEGLSRENVASHLQKYRLQLKRLQRLREQPHKDDNTFSAEANGVPVQPVNHLMGGAMMMMAPNMKTARMTDKMNPNGQPSDTENAGEDSGYAMATDQSHLHTIATHPQAIGTAYAVPYAYPYILQGPPIAGQPGQPPLQPYIIPPYPQYARPGMIEPYGYYAFPYDPSGQYIKFNAAPAGMVMAPAISAQQAVLQPHPSQHHQQPTSQMQPSPQQQASAQPSPQSSHQPSPQPSPQHQQQAQVALSSQPEHIPVRDETQTS
eukprot:TRINITY_DN477_c0_g1_i1.p1 TRINITY_DN477_c0_g1~~TRINITY_DN477_c0_g1_i1.p1  ORF type:complete len:512 (+),score=134.34 TRINITY_DN477_c0_g1_i1:301-1836(+)